MLNPGSARRRHYRRPYRVYSISQALEMFNPDQQPAEAREALRKMVEDDKLWQLLEEAHAVNSTRHKIGQRLLTSLKKHGLT